jgi:Dihaem cytochrome c
MLTRAVALGMLLAAGCGPGLPEPESAAAQAYVARCGGCHRAYAPASMTWPMWEYQMGRMRLLFTQLRRPWLTPEEERVIVDYLQRHAGGRT